MKYVFLSALVSSTAMLCVTASAQGQQTQQQGQQAQQQQGQGQTQGQRQQVPASELINSEVVSEQGQSLGTVIGIVRNDNNQQFFVIQMERDDRQVVLPLRNAWLRGERLMASTTQNGELEGARPYGEQQRAQYEAVQLQRQVQARTKSQQQAQTGQQRDQARQQRQAQQGQQDQQRQSRMAQRQQRGAEIEVEQQPAQVQVQQQPPQIIVRQPPPTITVQQPQPEIIVRMPEPEVAVRQQEPQVRIEETQPTVRTDPAQAMVRTQQAQPKVSFERTGEPQVQFQEEQGQPKIRIERMAEADQQQGRQAQQRQQPQQEQRQQTAQQDEADLQETRRAFGVGQSQQATGEQHPVLVSEIEGREVYNFRGEELGSVERVLQNPADERYFAVVAHGGFLGLGESESVIPIERFVMRGDDRLMIQGVTEDDLENMRNPQNTGYRQVGDTQQILLTETN